jgi:hypothetical protein
MVMIVKRSAPKTAVIPVLVCRAFSQSIADVAPEEWGATPAK